MSEKIKKIFFSNFVLIILASLYIIYSIFAFFGEYIIGKIDLQWSLFLRGSTIILDFVIILTGIFTWLQVYLRKKIKRVRILEKKRLVVVLYIADTVAIMVMFFLPYVVRLFALLRFDKITNFSFWIEFSLGAFVVIFIAFFVKKISRRFKRWGQKIREKNGFKRKWCFTSYSMVKLFLIETQWKLEVLRVFMRSKL